MIRGVKLKKLLEQELQNGKGHKGFKDKFYGLLGFSENVLTGEPTIDHKKREINPREISLAEVAWSFFGPHYLEQVKTAFQYRQQNLHLEEAEGHTVLPSHFSNVSAFVDTIGGLIEAMTLDAYENIQWIGDQFVETTPARVNGGKMIGARHEGGVNETSLLEGEPYPSVGLTETWVDVPDNERYGNAIQINEKVFIYDRTEQIQSAADMAGSAVARKKEIRIADTVQGVTNTYARDGSASNTYLLTAGASPNNYVNSSANPITTLDNLDSAMLVLGANKDPYSGWEILIRKESAILLVSPFKELKVGQIIRASTVERRLSDNTTIWVGNNPIPGYTLASSFLWYNRLIAAGVSQTNAIERYYLGDMKRAFHYRQIIPFETKQAPLSSEDVRRDILGIWVAREQGVSFTKDPRYSYRGLNTSDTGVPAMAEAPPAEAHSKAKK